MITEDRKRVFFQACRDFHSSIDMEASNQAPTIALFPCPGMSHLTPFFELAKQLVLNHGVSVKLITMPDSLLPSKGFDAYLQSLPSGITSISLPTVDLPSDIHIVVRIILGIRLSLPALRNVLHDLKQTTRLSAFVADPFCIDSFDIAKEVGVPPFLFSTSNLYSLALSFYLGNLKEPSPSFPEPICLPGCVPLYRRDYPDMLKETSESPTFKSLMENSRRYSEAQGILVNTFYEFEPEATSIFSEKEPGRPPVYAVGPLIKIENSSKEKPSECIEWLDQQPTASVLYISFGSIGMLTFLQMQELAEGLELSGQRFIWVVRCPVDKEKVEREVLEDVDNPLSYLPDGFVERTKGSGFLVPGWAPQVQILSHPSTVGFLTHCGWNSTLESIVHGLAMIAWPMYAEQKMNAAFLEEGAKVAIRAKAAAEDGVIRKEEVERVVRELVEGEEGRAVRENVRRLQKAAAKALTREGSSYMALAELALKWKGKLLNA